ncbi:MAG: transposase [Alphaproteobacteria bacterium]|nr:transposase [Alphaproteobacteria bacterium]
MARGKRLVSAVPHSHWITPTFVDGLRQPVVVSPLAPNGPMNGEVFRASVEHMLAPTLQPGDIMIMDTLSAHKVDGIRQAIEARGTEFVCLPPYSSDLNPIEQLFVQLEALPRKATARTVSALWAAIGVLLEGVEPDEYANDCRHAGYGST